MNGNLWWALVAGLIVPAVMIASYPVFRDQAVLPTAGPGTGLNSR